MTSETDNLPTGGTESAHASAADTSFQWDYYDPDEDQDTAEAQTETETESEGETNETAEPEEAGQSDDEPEAAEAEAESKEPAPKITDDVKVTLPSGEELPLSEIKNGYLRQSDYSRKTMEVANERKAIEAQADRISRTVNAFADFLAQRLPAAPDIQLSVTDPAGYVRQKAMYDASLAQVQAVLQMANEPKAVKEDLNAGDQQKRIQQENEALARAFPETVKPEGRKAFFSAAVEAAKSLGYSDEEIKGAIDHRLYGLSYWAAKGMAAEKAKQQAKAKVQDVPPVANPKRPASTLKAQKNVDAMRRLSRTGSIHDALKVDWD